MAQQMGNQPLIVLSDDSQRTSGKDAQSMNITAGQAVAESVRTTLGPKGMDKMLVSDAGDVVVTNDGVTILSEMDILSIPFGPSVVRTDSATAWPAVMFIDCASFPDVRWESSESTMRGWLPIC